MASREDIPRISVDKVEDWKRMASTCRDSVPAMVDAEVRNRGLESEREALIQHMQEFISRTFTVAQPNLRVNGNAFDTLDAHDMETFDEALDRRIWSLADTRFQWDKRIAENRKNVPREIRQTVAQELQEHHALEGPLGDGVREEEVEEDLNKIPDMEGAMESVLRTSALTEELAQTIQKEQERSERVKVVTAEVKGLRR